MRVGAFQPCQSQTSKQPGSISYQHFRFVGLNNWRPVSSSMRFHSTPQSALNGEITKLAIIESVTSVGIYIAIGLYFGTFKYLALAVVVAPLMLFRTEVSAVWALKVYAQFIKRGIKLWARDYQTLLGFVLGFISIIVFVIVIAVVGPAIRITATAYWAIRRPLQTLKEVPQNWLRQSFCIDFFHPPEIIPLEAVKGDSTGALTFAEILRDIRVSDGITEKMAFTLFYSPVLIIGYLPSMIYRVSFKATAIAYAPFIWVAHATLRNPLSTKLRLERFTKGELEKVRRIISLFIVTILAAKIGLVWGGWLEQSFIESKFPSKKLAESLVAFGSWPWWQITLTADALLTFFLFFFADAALGRIDSPQAWKEERTLETVSAISFLRAALALATISHFFYIALREVAPKSLLHLLAA